MELGERIIEADAAGANTDHEPRAATHRNRSKKQSTDNTKNPNVKKQTRKPAKDKERSDKRSCAQPRATEFFRFFIFRGWGISQARKIIHEKAAPVTKPQWKPQKAATTAPKQRHRQANKGERNTAQTKARAKAPTRANATNTPQHTRRRKPRAGRRSCMCASLGVAANRGSGYFKVRDGNVK